MAFEHRLDLFSQLGLPVSEQRTRTESSLFWLTSVQGVLRDVFVTDHQL